MKTLFDRTIINGLEIKNRLFRSATWESMADSAGRITPRLFKLYEVLAKGGAGLIIAEAAFVNEDVKNLNGHLSVCSDEYIDNLKHLANIVHQYGSKLVLQLSYEWKDGGKIIPESLTEEDIKNIVGRFGDAAARAKHAGLDGVQIHAAHGYLLSSFLNPAVNKRNDQYGGNENYTRLLLDIYRQMRIQTGDEFNIFVKINCMDTGDAQAYFSVCKEACIELDNAGINAIEISGNLNEMLSRKDHYAESIFRDYAALVAQAVHAPVILVGINRSPELMTQLLNETHIEYFSLSRPLIRQPDLINQWFNDLSYEQKCISCDRCFHPGGNVCIFDSRKSE